MPPNVKLGLVEMKLPNGQTIKVPKAFADRMQYDLSASRQASRYGTQPLAQYFRQQPKQHTAYVGLDPFLERMQQDYRGKGRATQGTTAFQKQQALVQKKQMQDVALKESGATRKINVNAATGRVISDTGQRVKRDDIEAFGSGIRKDERRLQNALMEDLSEFKKIGKQSVVSNLPVSVVRSSNPNIRSSMARNLKKIGSLIPAEQPENIPTPIQA